MIPEEAVEAAARAMFPDNVGPAYNLALRALEAAAPHMLARAWNEGYDYHRGIAPDGLTGNPYGATK